MRALRTAGKLSAAVALSTVLLGPSTDAGSLAATANASTGGAAAQQVTGRAGHGPRLIPLPPPSQFVRHVTNRYLPWKPGTRRIYRGFGSEAHEREVVAVLDRTKVIRGITATVVRDVARKSGRLIERTFDWYAQDLRGRVWYLGENTHAYQDGQVDTEGSWEAGVDGARPGIVMFRHPRLGRQYWQEFYKGHAEDQGQILDLSTSVKVLAGYFDKVRMTEDATPLEPRNTELKFYAPGVGVVLELDASPELGRVEFVRMVR